MTHKQWLIKTSEKFDNIQVKKAYKKKHWRNEKGEIFNLKTLPKNWNAATTGNTMTIYDYNHNVIGKLYYW